MVSYETNIAGPASVQLEFKDKCASLDPGTYNAAVLFIEDIIEEARRQAMKKKEQEIQEAASYSGKRDNNGTGFGFNENLFKRSRWHSRARGIIRRILVSFCLCSPDGTK